MNGKRPPLDEQKSLFGATVAAEGVTTSAGEGTGLSLIDAGLAGRGANSFVSMLVVIHPGEAGVDSRDATVFDDGSGEVTVASAFKGGQVAAGVPYKIVTFRFVPAEVAAIDAKIGTATDNADLGTLFGRHKRAYLGTHTHVLLVVTDAASLNADLDTALRDWLLDIGFVMTVCDPADVAANLEVSAFDLVVVSASCVAGDAGNLANLRTVEVPVICHSAAIAVSTVFNMGTTAATKAAQTQIEITDNSAMWLIDQATGNLTVTASATIYTIATAGTNVVEFGQEADGTNLLTLLKLPQGEDDDGAVPYAPFFDRYFIGVADYTNMNSVWKAVMEELVMHCVMEKRFLEDEVVNARRVYQEQIPDTGFSRTVDTSYGSDPPSQDVANTVVAITKKTNRTFVLRSLFINISALGGGTATMTFKLWVDIGGTPTEVDSVDVTSTGYQNLMDIFGLPEVHADSIHITATVNADTGTIAGVYKFAEAKK